MEVFRLTGNITIDGVNAVESSLNGLGNSLSNLGNTISQIGNSLIENISKPILGLIESGVKYSATIEDLETKFGVLLSSQSKAAELMKDIREISRTTPFETENLAEAASTMLAYGISNEKVLPTLTRLGDVAMGNNEHFKMLTYNMSQVAAAGKLQGMDLKSLVLAGWNPLKSIMETTGETMDAVKQRMSDGAVSYEEVENALIKVTSEGGRFYEGMAKGSLTLNGRISTLKDTFKEFAAEISKPVFEKIKEIVPQVTNILTNLSDKFNDLTERGKQTVLALGGLTAALPVLVVLVGSVVTGLGIFVLLMSSLLSPITLVAGAIGILIGGGALGGLIAMLVNLPNVNLESWKSSFDSFKNKAIEIYGYFVDVWKPAIKYLLTDDPIELAKIKDEGFRNSIEELKNTIDKLASDVTEKVDSIGKAFKSISKKDVTDFSKGVADLATNFVKLADALVKLKEGLGTFWELLTFQKGIDDVWNIDLDPLGLNKIFGKPLTVKQLIDVDAEVDNSKAKTKADASNTEIKTKAFEPIPNVVKTWLTDSIIDDMPAKAKTDSSNSLIKNKSLEIIPNVTKYWQTDSNIDDNPAKSKTDASNQNIKTKASEVIPNQTKSFSLFANIDIGGALSSIGNAFSNITSKISSYSSSIFANIRIPAFATGVTNYSGGLAMVGENGPELVNLPKGSDVYTANETRRMVSTPQGLNNNSSPTVFNVTIDARNIKDFNDVINVFSRIKTEKITRLGGF